MPVFEFEQQEVDAAVGVPPPQSGHVPRDIDTLVARAREYTLGEGGCGFFPEIDSLDE